MSEADLSMTRMAMDPNNVEDRVFAQFYKHAGQNSHKTLEEGRPIYDDLDYVVIRIPGDKDNIVRRPGRGTDMKRFPKQWAAYQAGNEQAQDGTPLEQWPLLTRSQVEELKYFGVHTIEALATMPDSNSQNFMGMNKLKQQAKDHVEAAKSNAPILALREENEAQAAQLVEQANQMKEMQSQIAGLMTKKPTRRGKPTEE